MTCEFSGAPAARRYRRDMAIAAGLYILVVLGGVSAIRYLDPPSWTVIVLALAPLGPALLMLRGYLVFMGAMDEFQRRTHSEAMLIALALVGFSSFAYGFLEEWAEFPHLPLIWVLPAIMLIWPVALIFVRRRYK